MPLAMALGETESTLRTLTGAMCPRCRIHFDGDVSGRLVRCPQHTNTVMVPPSAIADGDGDPFLGAVVAGRFAVLEMLGAGSMGTVYRARQEAMGRDVALKIVRADRMLDSQAKTRFQREAHAMSLLESPHTVTVFDFGEIAALPGDPPALQGSLYLAMELLDGESVGDRIKRLGRLELNEALTVLRHALASLAEAHDKGVIHRDLKPDNLLLTQTQTGQLRCKVLDFGIAKLLTSDGRVDALETQAGTVFGTPRYMSPEQAQGKKLDARSDLYALGVILYHMLVGRPPFADDDAVVVMAHHIKTLPKRPSEVAPELRLPSGLEDLLMRTLDKNPANRPQSAAAFSEELERLPAAPSEGTHNLTALAQPSSHPAAAPARRSAVGLALGIAALVLVVGGLGWTVRSRSAAKSDAGTATARLPAASRPAAERAASPTVAAASATATTASDGGSAQLPAETPVLEGSAKAAASGTSAPSASLSAKPALVPIKKRGYTKFDR